jgi:hypothetical protein
MTLQALREALRAQGGTVARTLVPDGLRADGALRAPQLGHGACGAPQHADGASGAPQLAARGPRTAGREHEYELLLEMIMEGSLLHYGAARVLHCDDPDLALLLGDQLYALGLSRLADLGDLEAVAELADLISLQAQAHAAADAELAEAVWQAGAAAIGWGPTAEHEAAKALARAGDDGAPAALRDCARRATAPAVRSAGM